MVKTLIGNQEFEQPHYRETEEKFVPVFPEQLSHFRHEARPIEQLYLSHPDEAFSLRLREKLETDGTLSYSATLKDRGTQTPEGLQRLEVETAITPEAYDYYHAQEQYPRLQKLRAEPHANIVIDFYEDGDVRLESEHPLSLRAFLDHTQTPPALMPAYGSHVDNEWRAHYLYLQTHEGKSPDRSETNFDEMALDITRQIYQAYLERKCAIVGIGGRSGSGKSTLLREVASQLHDTIPTILTLSTDDYHRGKTWLETYNGGQPWTNWDDPVVYDTAALAQDLARLADGQLIAGRRFNFDTEEPEVTGMIEPPKTSSLVLVEGIHAHSPDLRPTLHGYHEVATPIATCIGRRLQRDFFDGDRVNESLASPEAILRYMLETAEPTYQQSRRLAS